MLQKLIVVLYATFLHTGLADGQKLSLRELSNVFYASKLLCYFFFALDAPLMQHVTLQDLFAARLFAIGSNTTLYGQCTVAVFEGCVPARLSSCVNTVKCEAALGHPSTIFPPA